MVLKKRPPTFDSKPEGQKNPRSGDQMQRPEPRHHERLAMVILEICRKGSNTILG